MNSLTSNQQQLVKLERVLGLNVNNGNSFTCNPHTGNLIYAAGCVAVMLNPRTNTQSHLLIPSKRSITALALSENGRYLVTGECGNKASVRIWDTNTLSSLAEFTGHKLEIRCVAISPDSKFLVSIGSNHDMTINVWDWKRNAKVASHKVSSKIKAVSFSADGSYFVTVGEAHVKFWYIQNFAISDSGADLSTSGLSTSSVVINGRSAILGDKKGNNFCDVKCGRGNMFESTFCITRSGLLCEFNNRRLLNKWLDLRTSSANCLSVSENLISVGCANGVIRCFNTKELRFLKNLPRPHLLGLDISKSTRKGEAESSQSSQQPNSSLHANVIAISIEEKLKTVSCVYSDRSVYVWDLKDHERISKLYSSLYHSSCIWGLDTYPSFTDFENQLLPNGCFITCSSDDTVRVWNIPGLTKSINTRKGANCTPDEHQVYCKNAHSLELLKIFFTDPKVKFICDPDCDNAQGNNTIGGNSYDSGNGIRCLKISPGGQHLAAGSRSGSIRVFDVLQNKEICNIAAHDSEVLCLEYSEAKRFGGYSYLASSSRDNLIHIFDVNKNYAFLQTIDDHTSSITAVRFVNNRARDSLQLISCGSDNSIIFRKGIKNHDNQLTFIADQRLGGKVTYYDMEVDSESSCLITACQDRMIRLFNVAQIKYSTSFKGTFCDEGTLIKIALDPSGTFLATSSTDKSLNIYDYQRGECVATIDHGHSDLVTGIKFTNDGRHLISVSGDGCIFVWSLPSEIANAIAESLDIPLSSLSSCSLNSNSNYNDPVSVDPSHSRSGYEINDDLGRQVKRVGLRSLPSWAQREMLDEHVRDSGASGRTVTSENAQLSVSKPDALTSQQKLLYKPQGAEYFTNEDQQRNLWVETTENTKNPNIRSSFDADTLVTQLQNTSSRTYDRSRLINSHEDKIPATSEFSNNGHLIKHQHKSIVETNIPSNSNERTSITTKTEFSSIINHPDKRDERPIYQVQCQVEETNRDELNNPSDSDQFSRKSDSDQTSKRTTSIHSSSAFMQTTATEDEDDYNNRNNPIKFGRNNALRSGKASELIQNGLVINRAKMFQSRENLDKINSREKFVKDNVMLSDTINNQIDMVTQNDKQPSRSTSPSFSSSPTSASMIKSTDNSRPANQEGVSRLSGKTKRAASSMSSRYLARTANDSTEQADQKIFRQNSNLNSRGYIMDTHEVHTTPPNFSPMSGSLSRPLSKKSELTRAISEARQKLETVSHRGINRYNSESSKSVANLGDVSQRNEVDSYHAPSKYATLSGTTPHDSLKRSISLSDLAGSRRILHRISNYSNHNTGNNHDISDLGWSNYPREIIKSRKLSRAPVRTTSYANLNQQTNDLIAQTLKPLKTPSIWRSSSRISNLNDNTCAMSMMNHQPSMYNYNHYSSARSNSSVGLSRSSHFLNSTMRHDSSDDELSSVDDGSRHRIRPVTPPKPTLLRQIRRNSASQSIHSNRNDISDYIATASQNGTLASNGRNRPLNRKLWNSSGTMRSSKSEYNLSSLSMPNGYSSRPGSSLCGTGGPWNGQSSQFVYCEKLDLFAMNPASVPLTHELCQYVVDELQAISRYASRLYQRLNNSGNAGLRNLVTRGMQNSFETLSIVPPRQVVNRQQLLLQQRQQLQQQQMAMAQKIVSSCITADTQSSSIANRPSTPNNDGHASLPYDSMVNGAPNNWNMDQLLTVCLKMVQDRMVANNTNSNDGVNSRIQAQKQSDTQTLSKNNDKTSTQ